MTGMQTAVVAATVVLLGIAALRSVHRRSVGRSEQEQARQALRQLGRDRRRRSGAPSRGSGDHFWNTKVNKWDADRHGADGSDAGDSGSGGYGDSGGGGSSW